MVILQLIVFPFLAAFLFQFFVGCRARRAALRHIPAYAFGLIAIIAAVTVASDKGPFAGLSGVAALLWLLFGLCLLLGYGLAFLIYQIMNRRDRT